MQLDDAIRGRRTHKSFEPEPVPRELLEELLELARWAPNHHLTQPWRFRVLGPESLARLKEAAGPAEAPKLDRAPDARRRLGRAHRRPAAGRGGPLRGRARAIYAVLLGAHARGLASYWRTPAVLRVPRGPRGGRDPGRRARARPDPPRQAPHRTGAG